MSRYAETVEVLEAEFQDLWGDDVPAESDADDGWYNRPEATPQPTDTPYVHFSVLHGNARNTLKCGTGTTYRQAGTVQLNIYVPQSYGSNEAMKLADDFVGIFANRNIGHVELLEPFVAAPNKVSNWWETRVSVRFNYDTK